MKNLSEQLDRIRAAPTGPKIAAFLDCDGTLIDGYSAAAIYRDRLRRAELGPPESAATLLGMLRGVESERDYAGVLATSLPSLAGRPAAELAARCAHLFRHRTAGSLRPQMLQIVAAHRAMGHRVVIASSATRFQVDPIAAELDADHVLVTDLEVVDGVLTGSAVGRPPWGPGKAAAVRAVAREHELDLGESFGYSDGNEDVPFLESVAYPVAVCPDDRLRAHAYTRGWPILDLPTPSPPGVSRVVRTAAYYGSFVAGSALGAVLGALRGDGTAIADIGMPLGNDIGLALAGVDIDVVSGREYLTSSRPCVFVFNHQSKLDAGIVIKLLRNGFTGIAKKEARHVPVIGQILASTGVVFIDRADTATAIAQLAPAVAKLRDEGISLVLSPEGTRSATPRLGRFRKGAFHIAMQAGVPIVPIVIRNAGELMWRGAQLMHTGSIQVRVLPPVDTTDWHSDTVAEHADHVRSLFVRTLADWQEIP